MQKKVPDLRKIIEACANKDIRAEELLYKTYYGYVAGVVYRYVKERGIMKEVINDSFLKIFKKIGCFSFIGPDPEFSKAFAGWIGQIAANSSIDYLRSAKKMVYLEDISEGNIIDMVVDAEDELSFYDVMKLLNTLPRIQQLIFNLHAIEGFSHEEIAIKLNILPNTSRVYLKRARAKLVSLYQADLL